MRGNEDRNNNNKCMLFRLNLKITCQGTQNCLHIIIGGSLISCRGSRGFR